MNKIFKGIVSVLAVTLSVSMICGGISKTSIEGETIQSDEKVIDEESALAY